MFNCWMIIPRDTLYTPLFKSKILPDLWMQVSQDPVIGYAWSCPCLGALVLDFIGEKSLAPLGLPPGADSVIGFRDICVQRSGTMILVWMYGTRIAILWGWYKLGKLGIMSKSTTILCKLALLQSLRAKMNDKLAGTRWQAVFPKLIFIFILYRAYSIYMCICMG
jgi:hypothetical protein